MSRVRLFLQDLFNPLHVYCRLMDMGVNAVTANRWAFRYERIFYRRIFG